MKKTLTILLLIMSLAAACCLSACGGGTTEETAAPAEEAQTGNTADEAGVLVAYFSATGNTKSAAEKIAAITGADIYEIVPAEAYTTDDLGYNDPDNCRAAAERDDPAARPAIGSEKIDLAGYSIVYLGYPIWWDQAPRIMSTFVESCDFSGITVIPFCTSGSSGIGTSAANLAELAGSGEWLPGQRFAENAGEDEIREWISGME